MTEFKYAKGRINESVQFISREMKEFDQEYAATTWEEYQNDLKQQKLIDRTVENILTAFIEICGTIIAEKGLAAENYSEVLKEAAKIFGLGLDKQEALAKLAAQRNRLAHRYLDFKWQAIKLYMAEQETIKLVLNVILKDAN
ncbi:hypothetical protein A2291_08215 [candidate division WOR-1 bacterium RIFOXYB2_FULL_42_35]|uniref:DUF86 domain-containing protein n=1 Tax=candidate division WOR-1 bacterium RIFOXYC2_FULL_41_25 TaxID=1802586 RepID=A0A1F4TKB9_UNCSA|nr:MAG: hypothetical protein A2247_01900 [candidate division WOR-1 bacterium RIFOXYA2_FULL_41_14]OGC24071.1 MAG: hypothetical protein A2291_08215 [candidate division WOR-1 bacterium RIFOXYB2_FULL_42_35]OGC32493.1 MAG: hypothetical protein A2462_00305 [candidate division WOR-1 bacterium RIFOXYC2_FULL_41_25]OGC42323.1 MAG: hypothetical protein A2548_08215 [candidate division WOR-1 bacterium RIFOXYD2_FULL_41_8]